MQEMGHGINAALSKRKMLILVNIQQKVIQTSYGRGATGEYVYDATKCKFKRGFC
jgi:hypothetical protein